MASTKENPEGRDQAARTDTSTGEPIAVDATRDETPLEREQREITSPEVDDDGIHRGVTGPPKGANNSVDDGNDPNRPNITPLGRDVKYPHEVPGMQADTTHSVTVDEVEARKQADNGDTKRVDVNADEKARTTSRETPGTKR